MRKKMSPEREPQGAGCRDEPAPASGGDVQPSHARLRRERGLAIGARHGAQSVSRRERSWGDPSASARRRSRVSRVAPRWRPGSTRPSRSAEKPRTTDGMPARISIPAERSRTRGARTPTRTALRSRSDRDDLGREPPERADGAAAPAVIRHVSTGGHSGVAKKTSRLARAAWRVDQDRQRLAEHEDDERTSPDRREGRRKPNTMRPSRTRWRRRAREWRDRVAQRRGIVVVEVFSPEVADSVTIFCPSAGRVVDELLETLGTLRV